MVADDHGPDRNGTGVDDRSLGSLRRWNLALAALDHLLTATALPRIYGDDLRRRINRFRWVEYCFSATLMVVLIAPYRTASPRASPSPAPTSP